MSMANRELLKERKKELQKLNLSAWEGELEESSKNLDTSLKKNNAFIKKLKTSINKDNQDSVLKDIKTLSLTKYLSEIIISAEEGLLKCNKAADIPAAVEIISALHQRFSKEFTPQVLGWLLANFAAPKAELEEKDEKERISKVKALMRLMVEFECVGIFNSYKDLEPFPKYLLPRAQKNEPIILAILKESLSYKMKVGLTVSIASTFVKRFPALLETNEEIHYNLKSYSEIVVSRTKDIHKLLNNLKNKNYKAQIRTGRTVEDLELEVQKATEIFERFKAAVEILIPAFELPPLTLEEEKENGNSESVIVNKDNGIWSSEEDRKFYQVFPEIPQEYIEQATEGSDSSKGKEMNDFLVLLETANSIKDVDDASLEFFKLGLMGKASKNRLLKHFTGSKDIGRARIYARFLKTCEPHLDDLKEQLIQYLDQGFRSQIYHNGLNFRNIMFFCEMIKFGLIREHVVFHKIRSLILNLTTPNNIEILSIFFEISGKYLLFEHNKLMEEMLELLQLKRKSDKLTINNKMAISNLFLVLKPPSIKSIQSKTKTLKPEQAFLKTLVRNELNLNTMKQVHVILKHANIDDIDIAGTLRSLFTKPEKINYENIPALSHILKNMRPDFKIYVVDTILEEIVRGLEINDYRYNRIRVAHAKYIAEIHERRIVSISLIHDLLYKIVTFGHPFNNPTPSRMSDLDQPDDYFRVHLVCTILQNIELRATSVSEKLNIFLKYFDYYIFLKDAPLPKDCEFMVVRTFEKFKFQRAENLKAAVDELNEVIAAKGVAPGASNGNGGDDDEDDDDVEDDEDDDLDNFEQEYDDAIDEELHNRELLDADSNAAEDDEGTKLSYEAYERKLQEEEERKIEEALEKEFKKMVFESMNSTKVNKTALDLPQNIKGTKAEDLVGDSNEQSKPMTNGKIPFTLVTKKGKNIATKSIALSTDVKFANNVVEEERRRKTQKEQINKYILQAKFDDD